MKPSKIRIQLDLPPHAAEALDALKKKWDLRSRADAVRTALAVAEWVDAHAARGLQVVAVGSEQVSYLPIQQLQGKSSFVSGSERPQ